MFLNRWIARRIARLAGRPLTRPSARTRLDGAYKSRERPSQSGSHPSRSLTRWFHPPSNHGPMHLGILYGLGNTAYKRYYYHVINEHGKIRSVYMGRGAVAEECARLVEQQKASASRA